MRKLVLAFACSTVMSASYAQSYNAGILEYRKHYEQEFLTDKRSPLKAADLQYLRFFEPDINYKVHASFVLTPESPVFSMPTHSGKDKSYRQYGIITFKIHDSLLTLRIYQRVGGREPAGSLFISFTDLTTYAETFGGGRYIDLSISDIQNNQLELDFNKCYNPYCAYAEGYSCPIPPRENSLQVAIKAGEKLFAKNLY